MLESVPPQRVNGGPLGDGVVRFGSVSAGGSWLVIDRDGAGQLWQLFATNHVLRLATDLRTPIVDASAGTHPSETRILVAYPDGVDLWDAVPTFGGGRSRNQGRIADSADAVAVSYNAATAVTVAATTATMWDLTGGSVREAASLSYDQAVTSVALPPSSELLVAAGHADGTVTVDRLDLATTSSRRRVLTGASGPIATITLSADGATALAVSSDGVLTVWRTGLDRSDAASTVPAAGSAQAGGPGAYRVWLSPGGTYALVAGSSTPVTAWSLANAPHPVKLRDLDIDADSTVPAMITYDARRIVTIDRDNVLAVWDTGSVVDTLTDPLARACEVADLTEHFWRQIVPDPAYPNPCRSSPGLPTVNVQTGPSADP